MGYHYGERIRMGKMVDFNQDVSSTNELKLRIEVQNGRWTSTN